MQRNELTSIEKIILITAFLIGAIFFPIMSCIYIYIGAVGLDKAGIDFPKHSDEQKERLTKAYWILWWPYILLKK